MTRALEKIAEKTAIPLFSLFLFFTCAASAATYTVPGDFGSLAEALASDSVKDRDVIELAAQTHATTTGAATNYLGEITKAITVRGAGDDRTKVVLDCGGRGGVVVNHPDALFCGVTLSNVLTSVSAASVRVVQGVASNLVVFSDGALLSRFQPIQIEEAGMLTDSLVTKFYLGTYNTYIADINGGTLRRTTISACTTYGATIRASATAARRPLIEDCTLTDNGSLGYTALQATDADVFGCRFIRSSQCGLFRIGGTTLFTRCAVTNNYPQRNGSRCHLFEFAADSKLFMTNCLIARNTIGYASGTRQDNLFQLAAGATADLCHVTLADNETKKGDSGGFAGDGTSAKPASVKLTNCIVWNNKVNGAVTNFSGSALYTSYDISGSCLAETDRFGGSGNFADDPGFQDAAKSNYAPGHGSPCLDTAIVLEAVTNDLNGTFRPEKDAYVGPDVGAIETVFPLEIALTINPPTGYSPCSVKITAEIIGTWAHVYEPQNFFWRWIRRYNDQVVTNELNTTWNYHTYSGLSAGRYDLECTASSADATPIVVKVVTNDAFVASVGTCYVSNGGTNEWPYDTPATGAHELRDALEVAGKRVIIVPGAYTFTHAVDSSTGLDCVGAIRSAVTVGGEGAPGDVWINCGGSGGIVIDHPGAVVTGMTFTNLLTSADRPALKIVQGTASNVTVMAKGEALKHNPAVRIEANGLLTDATVKGFYLSSNWSFCVVEMAGGTMRRTVISNCTPYGSTLRATETSGCRPRIENCMSLANQSLSHVHGILSGADFVDCVFSSTSARQGLFSLSGTNSFTRCAVTNNSIYTDKCYGFNCAAGSTTYLTNCLVARNTLGNTGDDLINLSTGVKFELCNSTVATNNIKVGTLGVFAGGGTAAKPAVVSLLNSILWGNLASGSPVDFSPSLANTVVAATNSCFKDEAEYDGTGNIAADPRFANAAKGDFRLLRGTPCLNAGSRHGGAEHTVDLDGRRRCVHIIDMGCYECPWGQGRCIILR